MDCPRVGAHWAATSDSEEVGSLLRRHGALLDFMASPGSLETAHLAAIPHQMVIGQFDATGPLEFVLPGLVDQLVFFATRSGVLSFSHAEGSGYEMHGQGVWMVDCRYPLSTRVVGSGSLHVAHLEAKSFERRLADRIGRNTEGGPSFKAQVMAAACSDLSIQSLLQGFVHCARDVHRFGILQEALISMQRAFIDMCLGAFPNDQQAALEQIDDRKILPKHVRHATQYMRDNAHCIKRIEEVAQAVMTNRRSLEMGFKRFLQVTPANYLRQLRLERARADLLDPGQVCSVSTIANRWGFLHLGLFSRHYRSAYGELPSTTLARRPWQGGTARPEATGEVTRYDMCPGNDGGVLSKVIA